MQRRNRLLKKITSTPPSRWVLVVPSSSFSVRPRGLLLRFLRPSPGPQAQPRSAGCQQHHGHGLRDAWGKVVVFSPKGGGHSNHRNQYQTRQSYFHWGLSTTRLKSGLKPRLSFEHWESSAGAMQNRRPHGSAKFLIRTPDSLRKANLQAELSLASARISPARLVRPTGCRTERVPSRWTPQSSLIAEYSSRLRSDTR